MKTASDPRHLHRQKVVQELFAWQAQKEASSEAKPKILDPKAQKIIDHLELIDQQLALAAPEWQLSKVNKIDLAILRLAVYELLIELTEPSKVIIDESVELAKEFGGEASPQFVNGALAKILTSEVRTKKFISAKLGVEEERLNPEADLTLDLNATELEIADLLTALEHDLNISIPPKDRPKKIQDLLDYIEDQT